MKRILSILLLTTITLTSFAQDAKMQTVPGKSSGVGKESAIVAIGDTIDVSKFKYIKLDKGGLPVQSIRDARLLLTTADLNALFTAIAKLPYEESARAIEILKQFFGLNPPQK